MRKGLILTVAAVMAVACSRRSNQSASSVPDEVSARAAVEATANPTPPAVGEASPAPALSPQPPSGTAPSRTAAAERFADITEGTPIRVRLAQKVDTKHWRAGERFRADLDAPVVVDGRVVVPRGTVFSGHVVEAKPSGRLKGRAYLGLALDSFRMNGQTYSIRTASDVRASRSHKKRNLAFIGGGSGGGAAIGGIAGGGVGALIGAGAGAAAGTTTAFITGRKQVTLPVETPMVFTLRSRVRVTG